MLSIVIVDDDFEEFDFMRSAIAQSYGDSVCVCFDNAGDAISELERDLIAPPDFIFLDVNMQRISGEECLMRLRQIQTLGRTQIVMMSPSIRMHENKTRRFIELGAKSVAEKPDSLDQYAEMFKAAIGEIT